MLPPDYLVAIEPDLFNVTHLFAIPDSDWTGGRFAWQAEERDGLYVCVFSADGQSVTGTAEIPDHADERLRELHRRRAARRLVRQTLYDLCRVITGRHPAWGSLTGIRPTRLFYEGLEQGLSMDEAQRRVINVFDVIPEKAELLREIVEVQSLLPKPDDRFADVYIGIPFCTTRCTYCSFSSGELGNGALVEPYLDALLREMEASARILQESGRTLRAVYVGGGTPTSLNEAQLPRLLDAMLQHFPNAAEYTVEAGRPDTITPGKLRSIREHGVGRISINPQTMNDRTLRVIGRAHTAQQVLEAYEMARREGIRHINMDVIAGLPGEDEADFAHTMDAAIQLRPESLTVHTLAIKRSSRLSLENTPLPDGRTAEAMVRMGRETAQKLGMKAYYLYRQKYMAGNQENTGYALPGHACLYNVDIMEETTNIIAIGAGGISKRVYPEEGKIDRAPNVANIHQYIERVDEMVERKREIFPKV